MTEALRGARTKLDRADKHIGEVGEFVRSLYAFERYGLVTELEPDSLHKVVRVQHDITVVPDTIVAAIGDAVHNLRSALDHLACALALRHDKNVCLDEIYFPICRSRKVFYCAATQGKIRVFGPDGVDFVARLKPYNGGDGVKEFWMLRMLDNTDKHRALLTTAIYTAPAGTLVESVSVKPSAWKALEENPIIARWPVGEPQRHVQHIFNVSFNEAVVSEKIPVLGILYGIKRLAEAVIYKAEGELVWP